MVLKKNHMSIISWKSRVAILNTSIIFYNLIGKVDRDKQISMLVGICTYGKWDTFELEQL